MLRAKITSAQMKLARNVNQTSFRIDSLRIRIGSLRRLWCPLMRWERRAESAEVENQIDGDPARLYSSGATRLKCVMAESPKPILATQRATTNSQIAVNVVMAPNA